MDNKELIKKFYTSFSNGDINGMRECYHKDIVFQDPVFGTLKKEKVNNMWEMLLSRRTKSTKINFDNIQASIENGSANWVAEYNFGEKNRKVINRVSANFKFKDGKIIEHVDTFNLWKWTQQALGFSGYLIGWTSFMKTKIQKTTNKQLNAFIEK
ncbi:nuclear transport factor 2 family protein [Winogradskyella immobilis]|uniref:Nuclear transport factor 2 family protein n=1 Tax=Winogradskyella immobilis TaxID=2816852 RepID=A0ABS8EQM5_9FLAO|nr:nuclear transport factor 2 family protein [Winogradskyella immobilis]MCC1485534.1 nuclear transport factor 2 family protein [Winogradskyella immobilis]MCG0017626.1 nuclear transport factor 2 family protein [Winogradskyella immobilis]